jgi:hypothetical protein
MKEITEKFKIKSYDGGQEALHLNVENILKPNLDFHCSDDGKNHILILKYKKDKKYVLKKIEITSPSNCSAPLKSGVMIFSEEKLKPKEIKKKFKDISKKDFKSLKDDLEYDSIVFYFYNFLVF